MAETATQKFYRVAALLAREGADAWTCPCDECRELRAQKDAEEAETLANALRAQAASKEPGR